jgi:hypothetical protein
MFILRIQLSCRLRRLFSGYIDSINPNALLIYNEDIIGCTDFGLVFPDGYPFAGTQVDGFLVLDDPAGLFEGGVDIVAGELFRDFCLRVN